MSTLARSLLLGLCTVAVIAATVVVATRGDPATPDADDPTTEAPASGEPIDADRSADPERGRIPVSEPAGARAEDVPSSAPETPPPLAFGTVQLNAIDDADESPVRNFAWTTVGAVPGMPSSGTANGFTAVLTVPIGVRAAVRIAADGFVDSFAVDVSLQRGSTSRFVTARVVRALSGPCASLVVRDDGGRPVTRLRVTCEVRRRGPRSRNMWERLFSHESSAPDGIHGFSDLESARYRFRVIALDTDGRPRLLLPGTATLSFDGAACADASIDLVAGGSIVLVGASDAETGRPYGADVAVTLIGPTDRPREVGWVAVGGTPHDVTFGSLPHATTCELAEPIAAGTYTLRLRRRDARVERRVGVFAGQRTRISLR